MKVNPIVVVDEDSVPAVTIRLVVSVRRGGVLRVSDAAVVRMVVVVVEIPMELVMTSGSVERENVVDGAAVGVDVVRDGVVSETVLVELLAVVDVVVVLLMSVLVGVEAPTRPNMKEKHKPVKKFMSKNETRKKFPTNSKKKFFF